MTTSGIVAGDLELFLHFQADDRLVKHHVVQHAAQGILGARRDGRLDGLADGDPEASGAMGILLEDLAAGLGFLRRDWPSPPPPHMCIIERRYGFCW